MNRTTEMMTDMNDTPDLSATTVTGLARPRRLRRSPAMRNLVRETRFDLNGLIYPLFIVPGEGFRREVTSMPEVYNLSIDEAVRECRELIELGVTAVILFGIPEEKDPHGSGAYDANGIVQRAVRAIKSDFEIGQIRRAARISDVIVQAAARLLRDGITELELAAQLEAEARKAGHSGLQRMRVAGQEMHMGHVLSAESGALPSFMNSPQGGPGLGPWAPFGSSRRPIRQGEPVLLDFASEWGGYISDQTRTMSIGRLPQFWLDGYDAMRAVLEYVETTVEPGMTSGQLYDLAVAKATRLGYGDNFMGPPEDLSPSQRVPFVGHGVGLELDEWPPLQRGTDAVLQPGMVLAIEPKLIFERRGAIGVEDTFLMTAEGLQALTFSTRDIIET